MIKSEDVFHEKDELNKMMNPFDRVRGVMYYGKMDDFIDDIIIKACDAPAIQNKKKHFYEER